MREYLVDGERFTSVTTILDIIDKPGLRYWYAKHGLQKADQLKRAAADLGSLAHDFIMHDLKADLGLAKRIHIKQADKRIKPMIAKYYKLKKKWSLEPIAVECVLVSKKHKYAGRCDCIGYVYGDIALIDWKTGSGIYDEYDLQMGAYYEADTEMHDGKWRIKLCKIARFDKKNPFAKPEIRTRKRKQLEQDFKVFKSAQRLYNWKHKKGVKHV